MFYKFTMSDEIVENGTANGDVPEIELIIKVELYLHVFMREICNINDTRNKPYEILRCWQIMYLLKFLAILFRRYRIDCNLLSAMSLQSNKNFAFNKLPVCTNMK